MTVFEKNLEAIGANDAELAQRIESLPPSARVERREEPGGAVTITAKGPGPVTAFRVPESGRPPLPSGADLKTARMAVVLGFGSGALFRETVAASPDQTFVLLLEPDIDLFAAVIREVDFSDIFRLGRVSLGVGERPDIAIFARVEREFSVFSLRDFAVAENGPSMAAHPEFYAEARQKLAQLKRMGSQNLLTLDALGRQWKERIIENLEAILTSPPVSSMFGRFEGFPAVVVSAGPSLTKNKHKLAAVKGNVLIIAVDTAVRPLAECGVIPDIVVSIDSQFENYMHLQGLELPGTLFALNPVVYPKIIEERQGPMAFISYAEPMFEWIEDIIGERGAVRAGGSVATSAFDLAFKLGCSPIIFIGQDLGFSGGKTHAEGTNQGVLDIPLPTDLLVKAESADEEEADYLEECDLFGRPTMVLRKMEAWRRWFELIIAHDSIWAINATEGGVPIAGAENLSLDEALARYADRSRKLPLLRAGRARPDEAAIVTLEQAFLVARDEARTVKTTCGRALGVLREALAKRKDRGGADNLNAEIGELEEMSRKLLGFGLFTRLNRWSVERTLDMVEQMHGRLPALPEKDRLAVRLESYRILFTQFYETAREFETEAAAGAGRAAELARAGVG